MKTDPMVHIKKLKQEDLSVFKELILLFEDVFEMKDFSMPGDPHLQKVLKREDFGVFIALSENKVVGGLTTYVLDQYYSEKRLAYIYDLAVDRQFQRQGIGKKLIDATNDFYQKRGFEEVFVQADKVDDHAIDFYHSTQPTAAEEVVHFYYTLNK